MLCVVVCADGDVLMLCVMCHVVCYVLCVVRVVVVMCYVLCWCAHVHLLGAVVKEMMNIIQGGDMYMLDQTKVCV